MNYFSFSGLVNGLVSTLCGTIVYFQNRHSRKNQIYALYCLSGAVWAYFYFYWQLTDDYLTALYCTRGLLMAAVFMPTLHYHHILTLFDMETPAHRKRLHIFYCIDIFFFLALFTPYFVADVGQKMFFRYWQIPGPIYHPFIMFFTYQAFLAIQVLWIKSKQASKRIVNEISWIAIATTIAYIAGCSNYFLLYNIHIPPYLNIAVSIYVPVVALLFFRLELLDVRLVLKHISVVLLIYGSLLAVVLSAAVPLATHVLKNPASNPVVILLLFGLAIGGALSIGPFIYAYLVRNKAWLRGHMTDGLTHELKSPLGIILNAVDLMQNNMESKGPADKTEEYMDMIRRNALRLDRNVGDLLQVSKLNDGDLILEKYEFDFDESIQTVIEQYKSMAINKGLEILYTPNEPIQMVGDQEKINMTLSNILSNAIKYSTKGTIIIHVEQHSAGIICSFTDQGRGIHPEDLSKIFDRFYQGKNSIKGSGLGLAIAKGWIEAHGGKIWAESLGENKGTTVFFTLPIGVKAT